MGSLLELKGRCLEFNGGQELASRMSRSRALEHAIENILEEMK